MGRLLMEILPIPPMITSLNHPIIKLNSHNTTIGLIARIRLFYEQASLCEWLKSNDPNYNWDIHGRYTDFHDEFSNMDSSIIIYNTGISNNM